MQVRKILSSAGRIAALFALAAAISLAAPAPAAAADSEFKGWYANLDIALTQPNSLDQHYGTGTDFGSPSRTDESVGIARLGDEHSQPVVVLALGLGGRRTALHSRS